jgi:hypothetical protein
VVRKTGDAPLAVAPTPDGRVVIAYRDRLLIVGSTGFARAVTGREGLGDGAGGKARDAALRPQDVATAADGTVLVSDAAGPLSNPFELIELKLLALGGRAPAAWGAIDRKSYRGLGRGTIVVRSSISGRATVTVLRGRRTVARSRNAIQPGSSVFHLRSAPPRGVYSIRLDVDGPLGAFTDRTTIATLRRLSVARARRVAMETVEDDHEGDDGGYVYTAIGRCARVTTTRVDCRLVSVYVGYDENGEVIGSSEECVGRLAVSLAADGVHTRGLDGCRLP